MDKYQTTFNTWNKIALLYQEKFMDLDLYDDSYDTFCQQIKTPNPTILEIGCGPGNITKYLLNKRPDFQVEGIDVAPKMIELAQKNNPTARFTTMDCREINTLAKTYDAIICGFCLPYLSKEDVIKLIADCFNLLNKQGILYLSAIEDDYAKSGYETGSTGDQTYVYYHSGKDLQNQLKAHHFEATREFRKTYQKRDGADQTHLIVLARKTLK
ncbi:MAG: class I SAM-dependent methyltransferase [Saprospiraceae bacterium]|nr:class I SAM-dependent methyltransferase [Saprospiraceae bacterium]